MRNPKKPLALAITLALYSHYGLADKGVSELDELVVEGEAQPPVTTHYASPSTRITDIEVESINATTVEDFIKYEPSLVMRRRYIGDPNGTVGIRGANMFQTSRALVYADGLPLHYLLQTQYNGAPRWSLVSPDETQAVEVVYGPFSAEYSGNAMGGVVNIETKMPTERQFHAEAGVFACDNAVMNYPDSGGEETTTDLTKLKLGYELDDWRPDMGCSVFDMREDITLSSLLNLADPASIPARRVSEYGGTGRTT